MKRHFLPACTGGARVDTVEGRIRPHLCRCDFAPPGTRCTVCATADDQEMNCDVAPDAERVIQAPTRTPEDFAAIARVRRWALFLAVVAWRSARWRRCWASKTRASRPDSPTDHPTKDTS